MKNLFFLLIILISISCGEDETLEDRLAGQWIYEREVTNSSTTFIDTDTSGVLILNIDETGMYVPDNIYSLSANIEWDLQLDNSKLAITKYFGSNLPFTNTIIYDLEENDNGFELYFMISYSQGDTLPNIMNSEKITLTRE